MFLVFSRKLIVNPIQLYSVSLSSYTMEIINKEMIGLICAGLPGTCVIMAHIIQDYSTDKMVIFLKNIITNKIFGAKLYYVWKHECNKSYDELIDHNFDLYDDAYFLNKPL